MNKIPTLILSVLIAFSFSFCNTDKTDNLVSNIQNEQLRNSNNVSFSENNNTSVKDRDSVPFNYIRKEYADGSFQNWLRTFSLKPVHTPVYLYNNTLKNRQDVHVAVLDIDVGTTDLQQCVDAAMRLQAEYLFQKKAFDSITFTFTNGTKAPYSNWRAGYRPVVNGNNVTWTHTAIKDTSHASFRKYMNKVFMYCGTHSLSKELSAIPITSVQAGDVFIQGGFPGHAMIVMDIAIHKASGKKIFLLAQSYMPAQDIQSPLKTKINTLYFLK